MAAIPAAYKGKNRFFVRAVYTTRPCTLANIVYTRAVIAATPRLYFFLMEYLPFSMVAKWARSGYIAARIPKPLYA
jgi:hypothetical protein